MNIKQVKYELRNILSGKSGSSHDAIIQAVAYHLRRGEEASAMAERKQPNKREEEKKLIEFAKTKNILFEAFDTSNYISSGAEQKVYIKRGEEVIKLNDAILLRFMVGLPKQSFAT